MSLDELRRCDGLTCFRHPTGVTGLFDVNGEAEDGVPLWEVWTDDTYRMHRDQVEGGVVIDVGAHVGAVSVLAAMLGAAKVVAFEPADTVDRLARNVEMNGLGGVVDVHRCAITAFGDEGHSEGHGGSAHFITGRVTSAVVAVPSRTLNDVVAEHDEVALLKLDCEGCEYRALGAASDDTLRKVRRIVFEFHPVRDPMFPWLAGNPRHALGLLIGRLLEFGQVHAFGHPSRGGLAWWDRY